MPRLLSFMLAVVAVAADEAPATPPSASCLAAFDKACPNLQHGGLACHTCYLAHESALEAAGCGATQGAIQGICSIAPGPGPSPGGGGGSTGKNTWAIANPEPFYEFMKTYFPSQTNIVSDFPKCFTDEDPNDNADGCHCWCKMCIDSPDNAGETCSGPAPTFFQMHAVNAYKRPQGPRNISSFEADWAAALGGMSRYDPKMEFSVGMATDQLSYYADAFNKSQVPHFTGKWADPASGKQYYSLVVKVPSSAIVIELLGTGLDGEAARRAVPMPAARLTAQDLLAVAATQHTARGRRLDEAPAPTPVQPLLTPIKISWLTSDVARDVSFFTGVLQATVTGTLNATDGSKTVALKLSSGDARTVYLTQSAQKSSAGLQIAEWEVYMNALHKTAMPTPNYGFDRYCDFHIGHELGGGSLDPYIQKLKSYPGKYRFFVPPGGPDRRQLAEAGSTHFLYIAAPGGMCVQITGSASPALAPKNETFYDFCSGH